MSVQLSEGSLAAILNGESVKSPKLQVLKLRRVNGYDEKERHQLILSDGIHFFCLVMLGTHLNVLIATGDIQKLTVIKVNKYSLVPVLERRKQKIIYIFDLDVIFRGNQMGHVIGNPTRLMYSFDKEQKTEECNSVKTRMSSKSTIDLQEAGPSTMARSTSPDIMSYLPKEVWTLLKSKTQLVAGASQMQISSSPDIMQSPSQGKVDEITKAPEIATVQIASEMASTSQPTQPNCLPIFSLTPYLNRWTIKAWVSNKSAVYQWKHKQGKTFTVDLIDESGEIQAIAFNECCDFFCGMIEANKSYYISNGKLVPTNRKYTSIKYEYQLVFTENTKIIPSNENAVHMPAPHYNFQSISSICSLPLDACIDVLGVCNSMFDVGIVQTKASLNEVKKQDVILVDKTNMEIILTLWESDAGKLQEYNHQVIAIKGAKISEFMGMKSIHLRFSSSLKVNPDIPLAHELRHWFDNIGCIQLSTSVSTSLAVKGGEDAHSMKTLHELEIHDLRGLMENFTCSAFAVILKKTGVIYKACPLLGCNKKLTELADTFWCDNCSKEFTSFKWKMILLVKIGDFTNQVWITCFHDEAERLLNISADELASLSGAENQKEFDQVFENVTFKYFNFTLRKRLHNYKGEERFQLVAVRVGRLNYIEHNRKLIWELKSK